MPLVVMTGIPCSGKTTRALEIAEILKSRNVQYHHVCDNTVFKARKINKNELFMDSNREKEIRSLLMSEAMRNLTPNKVVILDAGNYIKGYRYELYCAAKNSGHTQLLIECIVRKEISWAWNLSRPEEDSYTEEVFDALIMRYEPPDSRNRWDSPLVAAYPNKELDADAVYNLLFKTKPPPPNDSAKSVPLAGVSHLYEIDRITQDVTNTILNAKKLGLSVDKINFGCDSKLTCIPESLNPAMLARYRRQFLSYTKLHPPTGQQETKELAELFVQFLNSSWHDSS